MKNDNPEHAWLIVPDPWQKIDASQKFGVFNDWAGKSDMPIEMETSPDLVIFRARGLLTAEEAVSVITGHFSRTPTKFALWDLRETSLSAVRADDFTVLIEAGAQYFDRRGPDARTAVVVSGEWEEVLLKAYEARALAALGKARMRAFADVDSARKWLFETA